MTHVEFVRIASLDVASQLPGFDKFDVAIQQILFELGDQYFSDEFLPRLHGRINMPRYEIAKYEKTPVDRLFMDEQREFLHEQIAKAQRAAHDQLIEKLAEIEGKKKQVSDR